MLPQMPQMVNGIYEGDTLKLIIMVWGLGLDEMTLYRANQLTVMSYLIMLSVNRADAYLDTLAKQRFLEGSKLMAPQAFREMLELFSSAKKRRLACYSLLRVLWRDETPEETSRKLCGLTRAEDLLGMDEQGEIYVLLINTDHDDASVVIERMKAAGIACELFTPKG